MRDYKKWHIEKSHINETITRPFFNEREIWYCALGANVGSEEDGKGDTFTRPILILRKFNDEILWGLPLTSTIKDSKYYYELKVRSIRKSSVILSQIRLIDAKRLLNRIGKISSVEFQEIKRKTKALLP